MEGVIAVIAGIASYAGTASSILQMALTIGEEVAPLASQLYTNIKGMIAQQRGPSEGEMADLDALEAGYRARIDARAAEAGQPAEPAPPEVAPPAPPADTSEPSS